LGYEPNAIPLCYSVCGPKPGQIYFLAQPRSILFLEQPHFLKN